jgi:hypothetical protein
MDFDELCEAVRSYVKEIPTEGGRYDHWRDRVDQTLAAIRVEISGAQP